MHAKATLQPLTFLVVGLLSSCGDKAVEKQEPASPRPVVVLELKETDPGAELELTGVVKPWNVEDIAFEVGGRLEFVEEAGTFLRGRWLEGEKRIKEGEVLAELDQVPAETTLTVAEADVIAAKVRFEKVIPALQQAAQAVLEQTEDEYRRKKEAMERESKPISEVDFKKTEAAYKSAVAVVAQLEAELESAKAEWDKTKANARQKALDLSNTTLYAPFDGEVSETFVKAGGYVKPGEPIARLVTMNPVLIELAVSPETNRQIVLDNPARLRLDGRVIDERGRIYQKSTVADPTTRTFSVSIITRNMRMLVEEPEDPSVLDLPRIEGLLPVIGLESGKSGPLYVEEGCTGKDSDGSFVWVAKNFDFDRGFDPKTPSLVVEKVRVELGDERMNFQRLFTFRRLQDAGGLSEFDMAVQGVPEGVEDGGSVALIRKSWQLNPGDLVKVSIGSKLGAPGFYVPMESILVGNVEGDGADERTQKNWVFVVKEGEEGNVVERIKVEVGESAGASQRIISDKLESGMQIVGRGVSYLVDGEPVSVTN